jgi:hypothetical protein
MVIIFDLVHSKRCYMACWKAYKSVIVNIPTKRWNGIIGKNSIPAEYKLRTLQGDVNKFSAPKNYSETKRIPAKIIPTSCGIFFKDKNTICYFIFFIFFLFIVISIYCLHQYILCLIYKICHCLFYITRGHLALPCLSEISFLTSSPTRH